MARHEWPICREMKIGFRKNYCDLTGTTGATAVQVSTLITRKIEAIEEWEKARLEKDQGDPALRAAFQAFLAGPYRCSYAWNPHRGALSDAVCRADESVPLRPARMVGALPRLRQIRPASGREACYKCHQAAFDSRSDRLRVRTICTAIRRPLQGLQILDQVGRLGRGQPEREELIVVLDDIVERGEAAVVIEATFAMCPQSFQWRRTVAFVR